MFPFHLHQLLLHQRHADEMVAIIPTHPAPVDLAQGFFWFCALVDNLVVTASGGFVPTIL
jgi:hypothetical protein